MPFQMCRTAFESGYTYVIYVSVYVWLCVTKKKNIFAYAVNKTLRMPFTYDFTYALCVDHPRMSLRMQSLAAKLARTAKPASTAKLARPKRLARLAEPARLAKLAWSAKPASLERPAKLARLTQLVRPTRLAGPARPAMPCKACNACEACKASKACKVRKARKACQVCKACKACAVCTACRACKACKACKAHKARNACEACKAWKLFPDALQSVPRAPQKLPPALHMPYVYSMYAPMRARSFDQHLKHVDLNATFQIFHHTVQYSILSVRF